MLGELNKALNVLHIALYVSPPILRLVIVVCMAICVVLL